MGGWDDYVDTLTKGGCQLAGIFGQDGSRWASNFNPTADELKKIVGLIQGSLTMGDGPGITLEGKKYTVLCVVPSDMLRLKRMSDETDDSKKYLFVINLSNTAVVVGGACGSTERDAAGAVASVRDHLQKNNY